MTDDNPYYSTNLWVRFKAHLKLWWLKRRIMKIQRARWAELDERLAHGEWYDLGGPETEKIWLGKPGGYCPLTTQPMTPDQEAKAIQNRGYLSADPMEQMNQANKVHYDAKVNQHRNS